MERFGLLVRDQEGAPVNVDCDSLLNDNSRKKGKGKFDKDIREVCTVAACSPPDCFTL